MYHVKCTSSSVSSIQVEILIVLNSFPIQLNFHSRFQDEFWYLNFMSIFFLSSTTDQTFTRLDCYRSNRRVSYKKQELLTLRDHLGSLPLFCWGRCCSFFICSICLCHVSCVPNVTSFSGLSLRFTLLFIESTYYNKVSPHFLLLIYCSLCLSWTQEDGVFICIRLYLHFIGMIHSKYNYRKCCFSEQRQMSFFIGSTVLVSRNRCLSL